LRGGADRGPARARCTRPRPLRAVERRSLIGAGFARDPGSG
jgi:hypothetical protein